MLSRRQLNYFALLTLLLGGCSDQPVTVYVVRHAEKEAPGAMADPAVDPDLSVAGHKRAEALVQALGTAKLKAAFSTTYKRTQQTVAPAAKAHNLTVQTMDADDVTGLVTKLKALDAGSSALVAGHSNTVPQIIAALGVSDKVEIGHDDYGDLFVVTLSSTPKLERRRFGQ